MKFKINKKLTFSLQYAVAIAIISWILWKIDPTKLSGIFLKIAWWTIPVLVVANVSAMTLQGFRWWLLLSAFTDEIKFTRAISYHFTSIFYSMILPTSAAQDVLRTLFVMKKAGTAVSWGAAWICKLTAIAFSLFFSGFGILYISNSSLPRGAETGIIVFSVVTVLLLAISFSKRITAPLRRVLSNYIPAEIMIKIEMIREGIYQYRSKKKELIITIGLTFIVQLIFIFGVTLIIQGVCGKFFFWQCLAFMPLIEMISMAQPITPNGMGVREALTALMFKYLGLTKEQLAVYIALILFQNLLKLIGIIPIFRGIFKKRQLTR
jgi:uncharacterized protein (TIRG00374 family)